MSSGFTVSCFQKPISIQSRHDDGEHEVTSDGLIGHPHNYVLVN